MTAFPRLLLLVTGLATLQLAPAWAAPEKPAGRRTAAPLGLGANSKEPIKIDADRLDVFDKESRAVFTGNVVAVQGDTTVRCSTMTIHYESRGAGAKTGQQRAEQPAVQPAAQSTQPGGRAGNQNDAAIRKIDCAGPVTVISKTQTATGDKATFDRAANKIIMTGNVALADGQNITRGEKLVYDTETGVANVETTPGGRVRGLFIPGSASQPGANAKPAGKPAATPPARN